MSQTRNHVSSSLIRRLLGRMLADDRGSVTQILALVSVPLIAAAGVAVDYNRVVEAQTALQDLVDRAALTAAAFDGTDSEKEAEGYSFITNNPLDLHGVTYSPSVNAEDDDVTVEISATVEGTLLPAAFTATSSDSLQNEERGDGSVSTSATARLTESDPGYVCLLATNTSAEDAIFLSGTRTFQATGCGIHTDSSDTDSALHLQGNRDAYGDFFHSVGGWSQAGGAGSFSTPPEGGKDVFGDPFNLTIACPSAAGSNVTPANGASLSASVYKNITMQNNRTATFTAGVHYIKGTIDIKTGGTLKGNGVTLVMCGSSAILDMNGGTLQLTAPTSGLYPGFAVVADSTATGTHELEGGPSTYIRGIWYTPKSRLQISGNADFNVNSAYFPVIVDTFYLNGSGSMTIQMDYNAYGFSAPTELLTAAERTVWLVD